MWRFLSFVTCLCNIKYTKKEAPRFLLPTDFNLTQKVRRSNAILPNVYAGFAQFSQLQLTSIGLKAGDVLVVQSLDRLGRNYEDILEQWRVLIKVKGVNIRVLNMPLLDTTNKANGLVGTLVADLVLQLFSFVAESERANIRERQREGIDAALKRGVKFGRPEVGDAEKIAKCVNDIKDGKLSIEDAAKICHVSRTTIRRRINNVCRKYAIINSD